MGRHVTAHVEEQFETDALIKDAERSVVDNQSAERCCSARNVLRTAHNLNINTQSLGIELGKRNHGCVGNERNAVLACHLGKSSNVGNLHLRISNDFEEDAAGVLVYGSLNSINVEQIYRLAVYSKPAESLVYQRNRVTEQMIARYDVASALRHGY